MTTQDVLALAKAGYTAEQISALAAAEQTQPQEQEQEQEQKPKQKQPKQKQPKQKPEQEQPQEQEQKPLDPLDIIAELREIKSAIRAGAYMGAQQPAAQGAEAALAAIINPPDVLELLGKK